MIDLSNSQQYFLNQNRAHYDTLVKAQFLTNIDYGVKNGLMEVARVFSPGYAANLWCGPCVVELVRFVYIQYDKWLIDNNIHPATFPAA